MERWIHEGLSRCTIHLYTNNDYDPGDPDFIEPWADEVYEPQPYGKVGQPVTFELQTPFLKVYGYFVADELGRTIYYERFSSAPFQMLEKGGSISITPNFTLTC